MSGERVSSEKFKPKLVNSNVDVLMQHILGRSFGKLQIRESVLTILDFEISAKYNWCHFLFQDEIENMVRQGEEHAAADLLVKERIEAVNQGKLFLKMF